MLLDQKRKEVNNGNLAEAVFVELSKAFHTLGHSRLLAKLKAHSFEEIELEWFTNYLFGRSQRVQINEKASNSCPVYCGVPQDSILGPTLYLIFFNNFSEILKYCDVIQFAGDTVIFVSAKDVQSIESMLNKDFKKTYIYFSLKTN